MNKKFRYFYFLYFASAIGMYFFLKYLLINEKNANQPFSLNDKISLIASISELLGLLIAITEIFFTQSIYKELKDKFKSVFDFNNTKNSIEKIKSLIDSFNKKEIDISIYYIHQIREEYIQTIDPKTLNDDNSKESKNLSEITKITATLLNIKDDNKLFEKKKVKINERLLNISNDINKQNTIIKNDLI